MHIVQAGKYTRLLHECSTFLNPLERPRTTGKQEFRRTDFGSRLLAAEGEEGSEGEGCV